MANSPHKAIQLALPVLRQDYYPDPPREPYVEVTGAELALICGEDGPAGPCLTCRYAEGMAGKIHVTGMVGEPPIPTMKCRRGRMLVLVVGAAIRHGCSRWEREPGADD
jgi:hypothetical protein